MSANGGMFVVRALRTEQANGIPVFSFFAPAHDILNIADIARAGRTKAGNLKGFQRKAIKRHVKAIVDFLNSGPVLFPNAIILAVAPIARFTEARGRRPDNLVQSATMGTLRIPTFGQGQRRAAWIVDGQQRTLALAQAKNRALPVPVVAFVSEDVGTHREQFIVVNRAKPLSPRLVDELLPEADFALPVDLAARKVPSALCNLLNNSADSPFYRLIRRPTGASGAGVVSDRPLIDSIRRSIASPSGALAPFRGSGDETTDVLGMYQVLKLFWSAVKREFPEAWGKPPSQSRLMHGAGIAAMGALMDRLVMRASGVRDQAAFIQTALQRIAPSCHWTSGAWPHIQREWSDIQYTPRDVRLLAQQLVRLDHLASQRHLKMVA